MTLLWLLRLWLFLFLSLLLWFPKTIDNENERVESEPIDMPIHEYALRDPLLFGDYRNAVNENEPRYYEDLLDYEAIYFLFQEVLSDSVVFAVHLLFCFSVVVDCSRFNSIHFASILLFGCLHFPSSFLHFSSSFLFLFFSFSCSFASVVIVLKSSNSPLNFPIFNFPFRCVSVFSPVGSSVHWFLNKIKWQKTTTTTTTSTSFVYWNFVVLRLVRRWRWVWVATRIPTDPERVQWTCRKIKFDTIWRLSRTSDESSQNFATAQVSCSLSPGWFTLRAPTVLMT